MADRAILVRVVDRVDETPIDLPRDFFGQVELSFRDGVLVNVRRTETQSKDKLKKK